MNDIFILSILLGGLAFFVGYWAGQRNTGTNILDSLANPPVWSTTTTDEETELEPLSEDVEKGILTAINGLRDGELRLKIMNWLGQF